VLLPINSVIGSEGQQNNEARLDDTVPIAGQETLPALPPMIVRTHTPEVEFRVGNFFTSVAAIFEAWVNRRTSEHTRRAYRRDLMAFVEFCKIAWPMDAKRLMLPRASRNHVYDLGE
jgi:hypothetical protein